jgi:hypothetical protein
MTDAASVKAFIDKWERNTVNERGSAAEHFVDLCRLLGFPTPNESDPEVYRFEKPLTKLGGGGGFADVWHKDRFAWEYKGKGKNLQAAYQQLSLYAGDLGNPPVLVVCDIARYEVYISFTGFKTRVEKFTNADLANQSTRKLLYTIFTDPDQLKPVAPPDSVTKRAAERFADVARFLEKRGFAPAEIAHFFMKVLFSLFVEDIKILPRELLTQSLKDSIFNPAEFPERAKALFQVMRTGGYIPGNPKIPRFNGWLFDDDTVLPLNADEVQFLADAARLDWSQIEPTIFGTLFERSLDPGKRSQLGAHYTSREDILLIVEPVVMTPLRRDWEQTRTAVEALRAQMETATGATRQRLRSQAETAIFDFMERLSKVKVLDPACGSGNFLYVALLQMKELEYEVVSYAIDAELTAPEYVVTPMQFYGLEKNLFAAELAQVVVWIGYLQWRHTKGLSDYQEPILQTLENNIKGGDAILGVDQQGNLIEPEWPAVDFIIGNPPFLGSKKLRGELGDVYFDGLRQLYAERVPGGMDLVMYWFERAREQLIDGRVRRVGLLSTNSIRQQRNRVVLQRIKESGDLFLAWSDRPWILDGAAVRVSMVGFDDGSESIRLLDGVHVQQINADLTASLDTASVQRLDENTDIAFMGNIKVGPFDLSRVQAAEMLAQSNPSGRLNSDVIRPLANGEDITDAPRDEWIIDFGPSMPEEEAKLYEAPYAYVEQHVKPERLKNNRASYRRLWWIHGEPRPAMWRALSDKQRYAVTVLVAKHRLFAWLPVNVSPAARLIVFAREDDYFFGVLHSRGHELWAIRMGGRHGVGNDTTYNISTCFLTYPFPWPPGKEPIGDPRVEAIAEAARALVAYRDAWLAAAPSKEATLTNLYNKRPLELDQAHRKLDEAVFAAYGWPVDLSNEEILSRLLALNLERAAAGGGAEGE